MNITKNIVFDTVIKTGLIIAFIFCMGFVMVKYGQFSSRGPVVQSDSEGLIVLKAADAEIIGPGRARLENYAGQQDIGFWDSTSQFLKLRLKTKTGGFYQVEMKYSLPAGQKTKFRIDVEDRKLECLIDGSGDWDHWQQKTLGRIKFDTDETYVLFVKPADTFGSKGVMNFCWLKLTPIQN